MKATYFRAIAMIAVVASSAALAQPPGHHPPPGPMMHEEGPGGHGPMFPHGVVLDEAQQDKVFAIRHAQEPLMREQEKAAHHAHEALRAMVVSGQFDEAKASALAQAGAKAMAAMALQQARADAQIHALLTPEQRRQAAERPPRPEPGP